MKNWNALPLRKKSERFGRVLSDLLGITKNRPSPWDVRLLSLAGCLVARKG